MRQSFRSLFTNSSNDTELSVDDLPTSNTNEPVAYTTDFPKTGFAHKYETWSCDELTMCNLCNLPIIGLGRTHFNCKGGTHVNSSI